MTPLEATRRRDLTVNAMMWDLVDGELFDPWDGRGDLAAGVLRAVDATTFLEDPLRALRVVQFAARLGFTPDAELVGLCDRAALDELPAERIAGEWGKLLLQGRDLRLGMRVARDTRVLDRVFPQAAELHTDEALQAATTPRDALDHEGRAWALMLGAWLHPAPLPAVEAVLDRLGMHTHHGYNVRDRLLAALAHQADPIHDDAALRHLSTKCELDLTLTVRALATGEPMDEVRGRAEALGVLHAAPPPILLGRHLKGLVSPGPHMGVLLAQVYQAQLSGTVATLDEALDLARRLQHP